MTILVEAVQFQVEAFSKAAVRFVPVMYCSAKDFHGSESFFWSDAGVML